MISLLHDKAEGTREMYREKGRRIIKTLGDPFVHEIDRDMLSGYIAKRLNEHDTEHGQASPHTVSKELITLRRALREAHDRGVLAVMPAMPRFSPRYVPREVWLTPPQFELVCAELAPGRALWASLAALGGMRAGEIERLTWDTVVERLVRVPGTKTDKSRRTVPIVPALQHRLDQVPLAQRRGRVVEPWGTSGVTFAPRSCARTAAPLPRQLRPARPRLSRSRSSHPTTCAGRSRAGSHRTACRCW